MQFHTRGAPFRRLCVPPGFEIIDQVLVTTKREGLKLGKALGFRRQVRFAAWTTGDNWDYVSTGGDAACESGACPGLNY